jgi:transglutaminase-like putative cysteine protease
MEVAIMHARWCWLLGFALALPCIGYAQGDAANLFVQAQEQQKDGKLDEALGTIKKAIQLEPKNDRYLAFASNVARLAGKYAEGVQLARQAIQINDRVALYHAVLAFNACRQRDLDLCREACKKALALPPQYFDEEGYRELVTLNDLVGVRKLRFTWPLDPKKGLARSGSYPLAVPPEKVKGQSARYEVTGAKSFKSVKQGDNNVLLVVPQPDQPLELVLNVTLDPYSYKKDIDKYKKMPIPRDIQPFLGPSEAINPKSATLTKIVKDLKDANPITTVQRILAWQKKHLTYQVDEKATNQQDFSSVDEIVKRGTGECRAWSMLFTGLCRAAGVPARHLWGLVIILPDKEHPRGKIRSHVWTEVYLTGAGWVPVDPQDANLFGFLPNTYIRMYVEMRRTKNSLDNLPVLNLLAMGSDGFRYETVK